MGQQPSAGGAAHYLRAELLYGHASGFYIGPNV